MRTSKLPSGKVIIHVPAKKVAKFIFTHLEKVYKTPRNSYDYRNEDSPEARFNRLYKDKLEY